MGIEFWFYWVFSERLIVVIGFLKVFWWLCIYCKVCLIYLNVVWFKLLKIFRVMMLFLWVILRNFCLELVRILVIWVLWKFVGLLLYGLVLFFVKFYFLMMWYLELYFLLRLIWFYVIFVLIIVIVCLVFENL